MIELPSVTITCDEPSHRPVTVAVFERTVADYGDGHPEPSWHWKSELAVGGGAIDPATGERAWRDTYRLADDDPDAAVFGQVQERGPKRTVRSIATGADALRCACCGLNLHVNREKFDDYLEQFHLAGASSVRLRFLVAMLT